MKTAALLVASLLTTLPAVSFAQGMDMPGTESAPSAGAAPVAGPDGAPVARPPKSGPYFGASVGTGTGRVTVQGETYSISDWSYYGESPTTLALMLRGGWGTGPFLFGMQLNWIRTSWDYNGSSFGLDFMGFDAVATWWDQEMGLYARAGIGPASASAFDGPNTTESVDGIELMLGIGFTMGGLGVGIDLINQNYGDEATGIPATVTYTLAMINFDFY